MTPLGASCRVVLIGAGSTSFGPGTVNALLAARELHEAARLSVVLVDTNEAALERMLAYAWAVREFRGCEVAIEGTTDRTEALPGADFVVTAVSVGRFEYWWQDFSIPPAFGFQHVSGECGGPGAAFHTLRSLNLMVPIARDMERLCPGAWLLNFTNPESRVCLGVTRLTGIRAIGLCHGFHSTYAAVTRLLDRPAEELEINIGGINHFHFVLGVSDRASGEDLLPALHRALAEDTGDLEPLTRYLYDTFGALPFPSDSHLGEFVHFGYGFVGPHFLPYERRYQASHGPGSARAEKLAAVIEGRAPVTEEVAAPGRELVGPIIVDAVLDRGAREESVNVPNAGAAVANLPEEAVVEVPVVVDAAGAHPVAVGALPEGLAALCRQQIAIQELLVRAYAEGSRDALLQALLLEPVVNDAGRARQMMEELLARQAHVLPDMR